MFNKIILTTKTSRVFDLEKFRHLAGESQIGPQLFESSVLSWQKLPPMTYFPIILKGPKNDILTKRDTPRLLPSQIEALIYIMQRFTGPQLANGTTAGFFLGNLDFSHTLFFFLH